MKNALINNNYFLKKVPGTVSGAAIPLFIWLVALSVRLFYVFGIYRNDPAFSSPFMDMRWHVEWARAIAMGVWKPEPFFRAPLYPFFLSALFFVFGVQNLLAPRIVQGIVGAFGCVIFWALGKKLGGERTGAIAGLIAAFYGPAIYFDAEFLMPVVFIPLTGVSLLLLIGSMEALKEKRAAIFRLILAGLFCGFAATAVPNILIFVPGVLLWVFIETVNFKKSVLVFGIWLAAFLVPVGATTAYNAITGGGFVVVASQGGINFWIGANPFADGKTAMAPAHFGEVSKPGSLYEDSVRVNSILEANRLLGKKLRDDEVSSFWFGQAFKFIGHNPRAWLKLTLKKIYFLANGYELPSNIDVYSVRRYSPVLRTLLWNKPIPFPFGILFPLGIVGMLMSFWNIRSNKAVARLLFIYFVVYCASVAAFFVTSKHRLPVITALIPFAALALAALPDVVGYFREKRKGRAAVLGVVFCLTFVVSNTSLFDIRKVPLREDRLNMGAVYVGKGFYEAALSEFRAALDEDPRCDRCMFNIGATYLKMKQYENARKAFDDALKINPRFTDAYVHLGNLFFEEGKYAEAERMYRVAVSMEPDNALAHYNLAILYKEGGDSENFMRELIVSNKADPDFAPANLDLAYELIQQKRFNEARTLIERASIVAPDDPRIGEMMKALKNLSVNKQ